MNSKRQTIWLVSMLSLMVILSAYYLFTGDVSKVDSVAATKDTSATDQVKIDMSQTDSPGTTSDTGTTSNPGSSSKDTVKTTSAGDGTTKSDSTKVSSTDKSKSDNGSTAKTDEQVLQAVQAGAQTTEDKFSYMEIQQQKDIADETTKLLAIVNDANQSADAIADAQNKIQNIEEITNKLDSLQTELGAQYKHAFIQQIQGKFKVIVQSDNLVKSQAVDILNLVMKELGVGPEKVQIQYMK